MKANFRFTFLAAIFALTTYAGLGVSAYADEDALELYPRDASDPCVPGSLQIRVTINGVKKEGIMKLELYNGDDGFLSKKGRLRSIRDAAEDGPQMMCVDVPETGVYAIAAYHDRDGNRKLKKKWNFTPREPYALSNNPDIQELRMPKFSEAAFDVSVVGADITLNLIDLKALKKQKKAEKDARDDEED